MPAIIPLFDFSYRVAILRAERDRARSTSNDEWRVELDAEVSSLLLSPTGRTVERVRCLEHRYRTALADGRWSEARYRD